jgi:hypothetical protein
MYEVVHFDSDRREFKGQPSLEEAAKGSGGQRGSRDKERQ